MNLKSIATQKKLFWYFSFSHVYGGGQVLLENPTNFVFGTLGILLLVLGLVDGVLGFKIRVMLPKRKFWVSLALLGHLAVFVLISLIEAIRYDWVLMLGFLGMAWACIYIRGKIYELCEDLKRDPTIEFRDDNFFF